MDGCWRDLAALPPGFRGILLGGHLWGFPLTSKSSSCHGALLAKRRRDLGDLCRHFVFPSHVRKWRVLWVPSKTRSLYLRPRNHVDFINNLLSEAYLFLAPFSISRWQRDYAN